ncbi:MAG: hypothetical protein R3Y06_10105 [Faecalibacterium sp.]
MICKSCGGTFADSATKCPYCGTMHLAGATEAYNQKFEDMNDDLAALGDTHTAVYKETAQRQTKHVGKVLIITLAVVLGFAGISFALTKLIDSFDDNTDDIKAQMQWQTEYFPVLDALYEAGEFDELLAFELAVYTDTDFSLYAWTHYEFLTCYSTYTECLSYIADYENGEVLSEFPYTQMLYFYLEEQTSRSYRSYTETDCAYVDEYLIVIADFLEESLSLQEDDLLALRTELLDDNFISYSLCSDYITEILAEQ